MITRNQQAFLDMLAVSESTSTSPATLHDGYDVIVTGIDGKPEIFRDYSAHPFAMGRASKVINSRGLTSNASGRYQFMLRDYAHYRNLLGLPDFGPESQDRWALRLIQERRAIALIDSGYFAEAVGKCKNIWASLPGAGYGQPEHGLPMLQKAYLNAGGTLAASEKLC